MASTTNTAGRKRSMDSRQAILHATLSLLEEVGFGKLSIEGIAARAGVGKSTIYRWWASKGVLAMEAFLEEIAPSITFPHTASAHADLLEQLEKLAAIYRGKAGRIVKEMIALGQFDHLTMQSFIDGYLEPRRCAAKQVIQRGIDNGEFSVSLDPEVVVDLLYAPIFHRMLTGHAPIDSAYIQHYAQLVLKAMAA